MQTAAGREKKIGKHRVMKCVRELKGRRHEKAEESKAGRERYSETWRHELTENIKKTPSRAGS